MNIEINFNIRFSPAIEAAALALISGAPATRPAPGAAHAPAPKDAPVVEPKADIPVAMEGAAEAPKNKGGRPKKADAPLSPAGGPDAPPAEEVPLSSSAETDASGAPEITKQMVQDQMGEFLKTSDGMTARNKVIEIAAGATSISNADPSFYPALFTAFGGKLPEAA